MVLEEINPLQLIGQTKSSSLSPSLSPCQSSGTESFWRQWQFQKVIKGLEGKINCQALGAAVMLYLRWLDGRAQTQLVSESAAVAAGSYWLAWGKRATTLAILTQLDSQKGIKAVRSHFFFSCEMKFSMEWLESARSCFCSDQSSAHSFTQSFCSESISHWYLSKNMTEEQNSMFQIKFCAKLQV